MPAVHQKKDEINCGPAPEWVGWPGGKEKSETHSAFFILVITDKVSLQASQVSEVWERHANHSGRGRSQGLIVACMQTLYTSLSWLVSLWSYSNTFEGPWKFIGVPNNVKKASFMSLFKKSQEEDLGDCRLVSLTPVRLNCVAWQMWGCCCSVLPGPASSKAEHIFSGSMHIHIATHKHIVHTAAVWNNTDWKKHLH